MEPNSFINAMYFMSSCAFCSPIPNSRKRMNFVKARLKKLKAQKIRLLIEIKKEEE